MANLSIEKDIDKAKKTLISKAKSKGIYENFGQKEVRQLEDKYGYNNQIQAFDNWCMNFDMSQISRYAKGGNTSNSKTKYNYRANNSKLIKYANFVDGSHINLVRLNKVYANGDSYVISINNLKDSQKTSGFKTLTKAESKFDLLVKEREKTVALRNGDRTQNYEQGGNLEKPLSYYKYSTPVVKMAWNGIIQKGTYYSAEDCAIAIQKQCATEKEIEHYAIVTPDMTIHLGHKQYKIRYPQYAEGGNILSTGFNYEIGGL